jgi:hypothetical protein
MAGSDAISPTAHYTGYVWARNGLSHPELETREGRLLFESLHPAMAVSGALGGPSLETYLLARHRAIDARLERAIEDHGVTQVVEVAAGLSPRGWRFAQRYRERITYVEADLPAMAERKRRALERMGSLSGRHRVVALGGASPSSPASSTPAGGWRSSPRGCSAICPPTRWPSSGAGSRARCARSRAGATSPTCISGAPRTRSFAPRGSSSRPSSAGGSTCTSPIVRTPRRRWRRPGSTTAR